MIWTWIQDGCHRQYGGVLASCIVSIMFVCACQDKPCICPAAMPAKQESCIPPAQIQLSQLDISSRERLKSELMLEIRDDLRTQWRRELEQEMAAPTVNAFAAPRQAESVAAPSNPPLQMRPDPLPPTQPIERDPGGIKILRQSFTTRIAHRLPVDERETFSVSEATVICFIEISSVDTDDRSISIHFTHSTGLTQSYTLPVSQSPAWRTWSKLNLTKAMTGTWLCEVFNEDGILLASKPFLVVDDG